MKRIDLNGTWRLTGGGFDCRGTIPGSVYSFLLDAGLMEDPFYRNNELAALKLMEQDYTFSRTFDFTPTKDKVLLHCDGLDTLCTITLNGQPIASTKNMHRSYEFDVTAVLQEGQNELSLHFASPTVYAKQKDLEKHLLGSADTYRGYQYVRKAHCMYGWDWGPMLPDAGIWKDIYLLLENSARITDCRILQRHESSRVFVTPLVSTSRPCQLEVQVTAPGGERFLIPCNEESEIESPQLWWPNGLGQQPLYTITVTALEDSDTVDQTTKRLGLRTLRLVRERDRWGESFCHEVNGVRFFAMGADYIPEDNILSRITPERTRWLLTQCKNCNFNAIRAWGGGFYPHDFFFDICDELGIVVFLDMMNACCFLPDCQDMRDEFAAEVRENLLRIRHHACMGLISGNNEVEESAFYNIQDKYIAQDYKGIFENYLTIFEDILPSIVRDVCPEIGYVPSSPSTCGHFIEPQNENYGDSHFWQVWHGNKPYNEYRKHYFRYLSEFGFQSFPCEKTVETFTLPEDRNIFSRIMERHQRNGTANGRILSYLSQTFLYPGDFGTLLYASQLLQATAIRYGVEHLRRSRGRCMGALYWQLNDIWPVASWSSIDSLGRYKALQYVAKRFFAPVMISCEEVGETTTRSNVNMQPDYFLYETTAALSVCNESLKEVAGTVHWSLRTADSSMLQSGSARITVPALSVVTLDRMDFEQTNVEKNHLSYSFEADGGPVSWGSALFTAPKHYLFEDPELTCEVNGDEITVHAKKYAQFVEIDSPDSDFILSDNYFDMEAGSRTVKVLEGTPGTIRLRSVYDIR